MLIVVEYWLFAVDCCVCCVVHWLVFVVCFFRCLLHAVCLFLWSVFVRWSLFLVYYPLCLLCCLLLVVCRVCLFDSWLLCIAWCSVLFVVCSMLCDIRDCVCFSLIVIGCCSRVDCC